MRQVSVGITFMIVGLTFLSASSVGAQESRQSPDTESLGKTVLSVFRERGSVPENMDLAMGPIRESRIPGFYETDIIATINKSKSDTRDEHQHVHSENNEVQEMQDINSVLITKDGRYAAFGDRFALGPNIKANIARYIREVFRFGAGAQVAVSDPVDSAFSGFTEIGVSVADGVRRQFQTFYGVDDNRILVIGIVLPLVPVPAAETWKYIDLDDQPSQGSAHAKVTLVEYGDVDCPKSAQLHDVIAKHVLPKYGDRVRIVFKDLPWTPIWSWTWQGSLASQCAHQIDPKSFFMFRSAIFENQNTFTATNVEPTLLSIAQAAGIPADKMKACIDSGASRSRVEKDVQEARILGIATTPTVLINGKMLIGQQTPEDMDKAIDAALVEASNSN
jgi:protein-disulfide isomerase